MSPPRTRAAAPVRARVRMYQVGFGDCFLLSFEYARALPDGRAERHVLLDFGSTRWPGRRARGEQIARLIAEHTGGVLDVLVVTHRHRDHLSGFADEKAGAQIHALAPRLVVRPWTERPEAAAGARGMGEGSVRFANALAQGEAFADLLASELAGARGLRGELAGLAAVQIANAGAIAVIDRMAAAGQARYVHAGSDAGMADLLPGVRVRVLGPPTIEQWPEVSSQRQQDPEFWMLRTGLLREVLGRAGLRPRALPEPDPGAPIDPGPVRWLVSRMADQHAASLLRIVRTMDDALNNTSVVLLFEAAGRRLLFPGDAQIESWSWALRGPEAQELRPLLAELDLYKVGHHGSRNATPRSLVALWGEPAPQARPLTALMSTLSGVHGESPQTAVPRETLVAALGRRARLLTTDGLEEGRPYLEVAARLRGGEPFSEVDHPVPAAGPAARALQETAP